MYAHVEVQVQVFLASALDGSEWSASRSSHFACGEKPAGTRVGPRVGMDAVETSIISRPMSWSTQPVAMWPY
jgi:hypothetical protein